MVDVLENIVDDWR